jgi:hypothetical protein
MPIMTAVRYAVRPGQLAVFESQVARVAEAASQTQDPPFWTCGQVAGGELGSFIIAMWSESVAEAVEREDAAALVARLFEEDEAIELMQRVGRSLESVSSTIMRDAPALSYSEEREAEIPIAAVVNRIAVRPGHLEACEELIRKVAEAVPKTGDIRRFTTYQPIIGDLQTRVTVRPILDLTELDETLPLEELLADAFGAAEGGLIYRAGLESMQRVRSELVRLRPDLSNP